MTYVSEIAMCFTKEAHEEMQDALDLQKKFDDHPGNCVFIAIQKIFAGYRTKSWDRTTGAVLYYWDSFHWNTELPQIRLIQCFLALLEEKDFLFLKLGEKFDDVVQAGAFEANPFGLHMFRCITFE